MKKVRQPINATISQEEKELEKKRTTLYTKFEDSIYLSGYIAGLDRALIWVKEFNLKITRDGEKKTYFKNN